MSPRYRLCVKFPPHQQFSVAPTRIRDSNIFVFCSIIVSLVCIHVECIPNVCDQELMWFRQYPHFSSNSSTWQPYSAVSPPSWCHPHIVTETNPVFDERTYIPNSVKISFNKYHKVFNLPHEFGFPIMSWKTYPNIWKFRFGNFEQSGSILQFYLNVDRYCITPPLVILQQRPWLLRQSSGTQTSPISVKNCWSSRVVFYNVQAEHESAFVLRKFWVLNSAFFEATHVHQCGKEDLFCLFVLPE